MLAAVGRRTRLPFTPWTTTTHTHSRGLAQRRANKDEEKAPAKVSLVEQLFPEETERHRQAQQPAAREIPRLPLDDLIDPPASRTGRRDADREEKGLPPAAWRLKRQRESASQGDGAVTSVLVLRNASPHLLPDDFRRLIPQGRHVPGWTLEQGDILQVIPGRDLTTLAPQNFYYLLFSSPLSAFAYQGHATRVAALAAAQTPRAVHSPMPPPPGYRVDGLDARAALDAFALVPASQTLDLRQLKPPLSPLMQAIVRHRGYPGLVTRPDASPFELRLTLAGPQLGAATLRFILHASGRARALPWSGGDAIAPRITKWEPRPDPSERDHGEAGAPPGAMERSRRPGRGHESAAAAAAAPAGKRRTPAPVHILGFQTEAAAQHFLRFWHRRPMHWDGVDAGPVEGDSPPIANLDVLW